MGFTLRLSYGIMTGYCLFTVPGFRYRRLVHGVKVGWRITSLEACPARFDGQRHTAHVTIARPTSILNSALIAVHLALLHVNDKQGGPLITIRFKHLLDPPLCLSGLQDGSNEVKH